MTHADAGAGPAQPTGAPLREVEPTAPSISALATNDVKNLYVCKMGSHTLRVELDTDGRVDELWMWQGHPALEGFPRKLSPDLARELVERSVDINDLSGNTKEVKAAVAARPGAARKLKGANFSDVHVSALLGSAAPVISSYVTWHAAKSNAMDSYLLEAILCAVSGLTGPHDKTESTKPLFVVNDSRFGGGVVAELGPFEWLASFETSEVPTSASSLGFGASAHGKTPTHIAIADSLKIGISLAEKAPVTDAYHRQAMAIYGGDKIKYPGECSGVTTVPALATLSNMSINNRGLSLRDEMLNTFDVKSSSSFDQQQIFAGLVDQKLPPNETKTSMTQTTGGNEMISLPWIHQGQLTKISSWARWNNGDGSLQKSLTHIYLGKQCAVLAPGPVTLASPEGFLLDKKTQNAATSGDFKGFMESHLDDLLKLSEEINATPGRIGEEDDWKGRDAQYSEKELKEMASEGTLPSASLPNRVLRSQVDVPCLDGFIRATAVVPLHPDRDPVWARSLSRLLLPAPSGTSSSGVVAYIAARKLPQSAADFVLAPEAHFATEHPQTTVHVPRLKMDLWLQKAPAYLRAQDTKLKNVLKWLDEKPEAELDLDISENTLRVSATWLTHQRVENAATLTSREVDPLAVKSGHIPEKTTDPTALKRAATCVRESAADGTAKRPKRNSAYAVPPPKTADESSVHVEREAKNAEMVKSWLGGV